MITTWPSRLAPSTTWFQSPAAAGAADGLPLACGLALAGAAAAPAEAVDEAELGGLAAADGGAGLTDGAAAPQADSRTMAARLTKCGFKVVLLRNMSHAVNRLHIHRRAAFGAFFHEDAFQLVHELRRKVLVVHLAATGLGALQRAGARTIDAVLHAAHTQSEVLPRLLAHHRVLMPPPVGRDDHRARAPVGADHLAAIRPHEAVALALEPHDVCAGAVSV